MAGEDICDIPVNVMIYQMSNEGLVHDGKRNRLHTKCLNVNTRYICCPHLYTHLVASEQEKKIKNQLVFDCCHSSRESN